MMLRSKYCAKNKVPGSNVKNEKKYGAQKQEIQTTVWQAVQGTYSTVQT
jgi:hypothetical protein